MRRTCVWLLGLCAAFSLVLTFGYQLSPLLCTVLLGLCSAMAYGINPLLTGFLPMDYQSLGRVGMAAGLIDALIYVGSAFSGSATASWIFAALTLPASGVSACLTPGFIFRSFSFA